jgi:CxxC-x17-CxxC domain-containing protein
MERGNLDMDQEDREMFSAVCSDCGAKCEVPFKPTEGKPIRCRDCFKKSRPFNRNGGGNRRFGGGNRFNDRPREMHKAVCSECKQQCEVPFKPTEGKSVLCKDCYRKSKGFE